MDSDRGQRQVEAFRALFGGSPVSAKEEERGMLWLKTGSASPVQELSV